MYFQPSTVVIVASLLLINGYGLLGCPNIPGRLCPRWERRCQEGDIMVSRYIDGGRCVVCPDVCVNPSEGCPSLPMRRRALVERLVQLDCTVSSMIYHPMKMDVGLKRGCFAGEIIGCSNDS